MSLREKLPASSLQQCKQALPFVDGDFMKSPSGPKIQMYSPGDGCETLDYRAADSAEIDAAVAAAASAFDKVWAELSWRLNLNLLSSIAWIWENQSPLPEAKWRLLLGLFGITQRLSIK